MYGVLKHTVRQSSHLLCLPLRLLHRPPVLHNLRLARLRSRKKRTISSPPHASTHNTAAGGGSAERVVLRAAGCRTASRTMSRTWCSCSMVSCRWTTRSRECALLTTARITSSSACKRRKRCCARCSRWQCACSSAVALPARSNPAATAASLATLKAARVPSPLPRPLPLPSPLPVPVPPVPLPLRSQPLPPPPHPAPQLLLPWWLPACAWNLASSCSQSQDTCRSHSCRPCTTGAKSCEGQMHTRNRPQARKEREGMGCRWSWRQGESAVCWAARVVRKHECSLSAVGVLPRLAWERVAMPASAALLPSWTGQSSQSAGGSRAGPEFPAAAPSSADLRRRPDPHLPP